MSETGFQSFEEFWPYYVGEHRDPRCRALHYVGTTLAIGTIATAAVTLNPTWLLLTPVVGYAPAWIGHFVIEKNRPATLKYPVWSLRGDLRMLSYALAGKMGDELARLYPAKPVAHEAGDEKATPASPSAATPATTSDHLNGTATA
jgi:hypothetical protein